jgi:hypothetical protein
MVRNVVRNSLPHHASPLVRLVGRDHGRNSVHRDGCLGLHLLKYLRKRTQGVNAPVLSSIQRGVRRRFTVGLVRVAPIDQGIHSCLPGRESSMPSVPPPSGASDSHENPTHVWLTQRSEHAYLQGVICNRYTLTRSLRVVRMCRENGLTRPAMLHAMPVLINP